MNTRGLLYTVSSLVLLGLLTLAALSFGPTTQARSQSITLDVPFLSQTAVQNQLTSAGKHYVLGDDPKFLLWEWGCGVASLAMVFRHYGVDTDVVRLNEALRRAGGFSGALLAWDRAEAFRQAGCPWIQGIERINTTRPPRFPAAGGRRVGCWPPCPRFLGQQTLRRPGRQG
jgi:hypothetical protein